MRASLCTITAVATAAAVLVGCGVDTSTSGGEASGDDSGPIVLGSHVPLTGPLAAGGTQLKAGAEAYFQYVNDQGGVNGRMIEYKALNDDYNPQNALANVRRLVERDSAIGIVSTLGTATGLAVLPYLESRNVAYVGALSGDSRLLGVDAESPAFGIAPTGVEMGGSLGRHAVEELGGKRVAIFYQNDAYGTDGRDGLRQGVEEAGGEIVGEAPYELSQTDFTSQIRELQSARPDVVALYALPTTAAAFLKQAKGRGFDATFTADNPMTDPIMVGLAGNALEGLNCNFFTAVNGETSPEVREKAEILAKYAPDVDGGYYSFQGMAGAIVAVEALETIEGEVTSASFVEALEGVSVDPAVTAPIEYGPDDHQGGGEFGFAVWRNGRIKVLEDY